jgi:acetolactate synthase-1/2/3 large subunit
MRSPMARQHVRGHIRTVCECLIKLLSADNPSGNDLDRKLVSDTYKAEVTFQAPESYHSNATPLKPQRLMKTLSERCPPTTRFLADTGNSMVWTAHYLQPHNRRTERKHLHVVGQMPERRLGTANWLRVIMDFCPMGWAIGAAVGIARGNPACPVVCITGDGAFLMSGQEITVAATEGLSVVFVILNDGALGMVKHGQRLAQAEPIGYELPQVDYSKLAQAMGIPGHVINSPQSCNAKGRHC